MSMAKTGGAGAGSCPSSVNEGGASESEDGAASIEIPGQTSDFLGPYPAPRMRVALPIEARPRCTLLILLLIAVVVFACLAAALAPAPLAFWFHVITTSSSTGGRIWASFLVVGLVFPSAIAGALYLPGVALAIAACAFGPTPTLVLASDSILDIRTSNDRVPWDAFRHARIVLGKYGYAVSLTPRPGVKIAYKRIRPGPWGLICRNENEFFIPANWPLSVPEHIVVHVVEELVLRHGGEVVRPYAAFGRPGVRKRSQPAPPPPGHP
jgi:hypothetical protein